MNVTQGRLRTLGSSLGQASPAWRRSWSPVQPQSVGVRPLEEMGDQKAEREQFLCSYCLDKILAACAGSCSEQTFNQGVISLCPHSVWCRSLSPAARNAHRAPSLTQNSVCNEELLERRTFTWQLTMLSANPDCFTGSN